VANTPFRKHKTWVHEGGIATSCVIRWPKGLSAKGSWNSTPAHLVDILPTVLAAAGIEPPVLKPGQPQRPGVNLLPGLREGAPVSRTTALWWLHEGNAAVSQGDLKLVRAKEQPWELYDLAQDRTETTNLAAKRPNDAAKLAALWESQWIQFQKDAKLPENQ
jgi:arylsulfatase